ncbi:MAG: hypothetical protein PVH90_10335 [Gammaproteobacteria bacterium]
MPAPMRFALWTAVAAATFGWSAAVASDARDGTLFGYSVGDTYPLTGATRVLARSPAPTRLVTLVAEAPVKPDDIDRVLLITTPVSSAIIIIGVQQGFADIDAARDFARKYLQLFAAKYPDSEADLEVMDRRGRIRFSPDYELVLTLLEGDRVDLVDANWVVEMLYQARQGSEPARRLAELMDSDIDAMRLDKEDSRGL